MSSSEASTYDRRRYAVSAATVNGAAVVPGWDSHPANVWSGSWLTEPVSGSLAARPPATGV